MNKVFEIITTPEMRELPSKVAKMLDESQIVAFNDSNRYYEILDELKSMSEHYGVSAYDMLDFGNRYLAKFEGEHYTLVVSVYRKLFSDNKVWITRKPNISCTTKCFERKVQKDKEGRYYVKFDHNKLYLSLIGECFEDEE